MLTIELRERHFQQKGQTGITSKALIPIVFAGGLAGSADRCQQQRAPDGESSTDCSAMVGKVLVDCFYHLQLFGDLKQSRDRSMTIALYFMRNTFTKPFKEVLGTTQISQDNGPGFAVDSPGLDDAPVSIAPGYALLKGGHIGVYI